MQPLRFFTATYTAPRRKPVTAVVCAPCVQTAFTRANLRRKAQGYTGLVVRAMPAPPLVAS